MNADLRFRKQLARFDVEAKANGYAWDKPYGVMDEAESAFWQRYHEVFGMLEVRSRLDAIEKTMATMSRAVTALLQEQMNLRDELAEMLNLEALFRDELASVREDASPGDVLGMIAPIHRPKAIPH